MQEEAELKRKAKERKYKIKRGREQDFFSFKKIVFQVEGQRIVEHKV